MRKRRRRSRHCFEEIPSGTLRRERSDKLAGLRTGPSLSPVQGRARGGMQGDLPDLSAQTFDGDDKISAGNAINQAEEELPHETRDRASGSQTSEHVDLNTPVNLSGCCNIEDQRYGQDSFETPVKNWRVLWALLRTSGTRRFTKEQYQSVRFLTESAMQERVLDWKDDLLLDDPNDASSSRKSYLPHYSTLNKSVKPELYRHLAARYFDHLETVNLRKAGARSRQQCSNGDPVIAVRTVVPSEYARLDMATPQVFNDMRRTSLAFCEEQKIESAIPRISSADCVDLVPLISAREWYFGRPRAIAIDGMESSWGQTFFAEVGDIIQISTVTNEISRESFQRCFLANRDTEQYHEIQGKVLHVWTVSHLVRKGIDGTEDAEDEGSLSSRDRSIKNLFDFVQYNSPSDSIYVVVPEIPCERDNDGNASDEEECVLRRREEVNELKRLRKRAVLEKKRQMEAAWRNWRKPIVKPGDTIALLCPCDKQGRTCEPEGTTLLTSTDIQSRVLFINRYWSEEEERSSHVLWIAGGTDFAGTPVPVAKRPEDLQPFCTPLLARNSAIYAHVRKVVRAQAHSGPRGPQTFPAVSSFGTLATEEPYFVYRFVLFWDGFNVQASKEGSGDGSILCA